MSLSIVYADEGKLQAILLPPSNSFYPFDPRIPSALPHLERFHIDYSRYFAALPKTSPYELGQWIDFSDGGNAITYETGGWWNPEPWGTWTVRTSWPDYRRCRRSEVGPGVGGRRRSVRETRGIRPLMWKCS